jgi:hypothetical protein
MTSDRHWLQVGEFVADFGGNEPGHVTTLAGRTLQFNFEDGSSDRYRFVSEELAQIGDAPAAREVSYRATQLRPGILLIDHLESGKPTRSITLVVDMLRQACTKIVGDLPGREEALIPLFTRVLNKQSLSAVTAKFMHGAIDAPFTAATHRHLPTDELTGRRVHHEYGTDDAYEHIYLEADLYTWHCIKGPEVGLADTDRCFMRKLDEQLYLFAWVEKIIPTLGVVMMDLTSLRTTGKLFGYRGGDFGETVNSPVGAISKLVNVTRYDR